MAFVKISEQSSLYNDLEKKSVREILEDINTEDQKVALAVQKAIPQIEKLVSQIVPRMKQPSSSKGTSCAGSGLPAQMNRLCQARSRPAHTQNPTATKLSRAPQQGFTTTLYANSTSTFRANSKNFPSRLSCPAPSSR